jgi:hypothetical protein
MKLAALNGQNSFGSKEPKPSDSAKLAEKNGKKVSCKNAENPPKGAQIGTLASADATPPEIDKNSKNISEHLLAAPSTGACAVSHAQVRLILPSWAVHFFSETKNES